VAERLDVRVDGGGKEEPMLGGEKCHKEKQCERMGDA
jgi:hypothetical protein